MRGVCSPRAPGVQMIPWPQNLSEITFSEKVSCSSSRWRNSLLPLNSYVSNSAVLFDNATFLFEILIICVWLLPRFFLKFSLFVSGCTVFVAVRVFPQLWWVGAAQSPAGSAQASHGKGFSWCRGWALGHAGFSSCGPWAESTGSIVLVHGFKLLRGMWDLPESGI